jgi:hypothetical protein
VIPCESPEEDVVVDVSTGELMEKIYPYRTNWPSGLVMTTSHAPAVLFAGGVNVHVIRVADTTFTFVAVIFGLPSLMSMTVAPELKFVPVSEVIAISVPASPASGIIFLNVGLPVGDAVTVVVVVVFVVELVCVVETGAVVEETVKVWIGTEADGIFVIFSVYTFSNTARVSLSVIAFFLYPQLPSALG